MGQSTYADGGSVPVAPDYAPADHYDRVTTAWSEVMGAEFHYGVFESPDVRLPQGTAALTRLMLESAGLSAGQKVLDVGCGVGTQAIQMARLGAEVLGISTSTEGVARAGATAATASGSARFEVRDGTDNGLPDGVFDVVWVLESSHLMRDKAALLGECSRVLKPGGRLALCDIVRRREIPFLEVRDRRSDFARLRSAFGDAHMEPLAVYRALMESVGLSVLVERDLTSETRPTLRHWRENAERERELMVRSVGQQGLDDFLAATFILDGFWADGTLGYGIIAGEKI